MRTPSRPRSQGFTLIELLVVISIIAILAGMLLPAINMVRQSAYKANCGSNQRQIALAFLTYANDSDQQWPVLYITAASGNGSAGTAPTLAQAVYTTMGTFEYVANSMGGDLGPKIFACPANPTVKPPAAAAAVGWGSSTASTWTSTPSSTATNAQAYAYDWAAPATSSSSRVLMSDRPKSATDFSNHKNTVVVVFADGHQGSLNKSTGTSASSNVYDQTNAAFAAGKALNKEGSTAGENIFDDTDETAAGTSVYAAAGAGLAMGKGATTYAWVK